jgi:hypothetical protein
MPKGARVAVVLSLVVVVAWLGFRATRAFDQSRHAAEAAAVLAAPDVVTYQLPPAAPAPASADGQGREPAGQPSPQSRVGGAPGREGSPQPGGALGAVHSPGPVADRGGVCAPWPTTTAGRVSPEPHGW